MCPNVNAIIFLCVLSLIALNDLNFSFKDCPGVESETAGKSSSCEGCPNQVICASGQAKQQDPGSNQPY